MLWTPEAVEERIREALRTLHRLPAGRIWPAGIRVAWPDIVRDWEGYGWDRATRPRVQATARDIARMDEVFDWTARWLSAAKAQAEGLPPDAVKILMWRCSGRRWDQIGMLRVRLWAERPTEGGGRSKIPGGNSYPSLVRIHRAALALLARRLNGGLENLAHPAEVSDDGNAPQYEVVVEVTFPVGEQGTYGPVHAKACHVVRPKRRRGQ